MLTRPFYFGRQDRLFGVIDAPDAGTTSEAGVLICQPLGHEYFRCHRACRQLALHLVRAGFTVMRFDYEGCGDSVGESHEVAFDSWLDDVAVAIEHTRAHCRSLSVVGLRLGASLALLAGERRRDIDRMVLWELVVGGRGYMREMRAQHSLQEARHGQGEGSAAPGLPANVTEILGVTFAPAAVSLMESLDMRAVACTPARSVLLLSNSEASEMDVFRPAFEPSAQVERMLVRERSSWLLEPAVIPVDSIAAIVQWLSTATR